MLQYPQIPLKYSVDVLVVRQFPECVVTLIFQRKKILEYRWRTQNLESKTIVFKSSSPILWLCEFPKPLFFIWKVEILIYSLPNFIFIKDLEDVDVKDLES